MKINEINFYWKHHLKYLQSFNSLSVLEFGAGKSLEQNIYLSYKFDNKLSQTVIDISNMLDIELFNDANAQISNVLKTKVKPQVKSVNEIKKFYNIEYLSPYTIEKISKEDFNFDACISSTTIEHLPINELQKTFTFLKKIIKKNGIISSLIDYSDHYSHTDKKIGPLNFLQYSKDVWKKYNTPYFFQNRLRHQDYRNLFLEMNYEIIEEIKGDTGNFPKVISDNFDSGNEETFSLWGLFVLKMK